MVVNAATTEIKDLDCRGRISAPIVEMSFAPNGRFLACFTEASMLTVISTTFETKVLDFDTSEGSSQPPLEMKWCGEDRYVHSEVFLRAKSLHDADRCSSVWTVHLVSFYIGKTWVSSWLGPMVIGYDFLTRIKAICT